MERVGRGERITTDRRLSGGGEPVGGPDRLMFGAMVDRHPPAASGIGPFASPHFLDTVWRHTALPGQVPLVLADEDGGVVLVESGDRIGMVGHEDLVDYRSPTGDIRALLADRFRRLDPGRRFRFDSLPARAANVFTTALDEAGIPYRVAPHTSTAVLDLPASYDDYLGSLGKKERHETRRKGRRFEAALGAPRVVTSRETGPALESFFRLHRRSHGSKGSFMTDRMAGMFTDLLAGDGWQLDAMYGEGPRLVAAVIGYVDRSGYYLYNSAYDPELCHASPGVVLLSEMIRLAIGKGLEVFDFLKGDERYKFRMGARSRSLFVVEGTT